jgi:hypothetical protein
MPNPQLGGHFAPKATFGCGDDAQSANLHAHSSTKPTDIDPECSFKPHINRNIPDFGRMHAVLARQLAANKEARKFQQVTLNCISFIFLSTLQQITKAPTPFSFAQRTAPAAQPPRPTPADIAAMAREGGVKQVTTSSWETFTQVLYCSFHHATALVPNTI